MAAANPGSPTFLARTLEGVFEDAKSSGALNLSNRKLKDYPSIVSEHDLVDTTELDISRNRFTEVPGEISRYESLEKVTCYGNYIRSLPGSFVNLTCLRYLNISRNQLSHLPSFIGQLSSLEVLLVTHNKLVSLPEEIQGLIQLNELDVSFNDIRSLPPHLGQLQSLKSLNVRRNHLVELPVELSVLSLIHLDISENQVESLPLEFRALHSLESLCIDDNPLTRPPAKLCTKGLTHIMKYLYIESLRENRKLGAMAENRPYRQREGRRSLRGEDGKLQNRRHTVTISSTTSAASASGASSTTALADGGSSPNMGAGPGLTTPLRTADGGSRRRDRREELRRATLDGPGGAAWPSLGGVRTSGPGIGGSSLLRGGVGGSGVCPPPPPPDIRLTAGLVGLAAGRASASAAGKGGDDKNDASGAVSPLALRHEDVFARELQKQKADLEVKKRRSEQIKQEEKLKLERKSSESLTSGASEDSGHQPGSGREPDSDSRGSPDLHGYNGLPSSDGSSESRLHPATDAPQKKPLSTRGTGNGSSIQSRSSLSGSTGGMSLNRSSPLRTGRTSLTGNHTSASGGLKKAIPTSQVSGSDRAEVARSNGSRIGTVSSAPGIRVTGSPGTGPPGNGDSARFTMHREMEHIQEDIRAVQAIKKVLEPRLRITMGDKVQSELRNGILLCQLAKSVRETAVSPIHLPTPSVPKLSVAKSRRNVENFLEACRTIGVPQEQLCTAQDILEEKRVTIISKTVTYLSEVAKRVKQTVKKVSGVTNQSTVV